MAKDKEKIKNFDPGFGVDYKTRTKRIINKNGSFNIKRHGMRKLVFHSLRSMGNLRFFTVVIITYMLVNLLFAFIYYLSGIEHIVASQTHLNVPDLLMAFFFSMQTFTTVGFGSIFPDDAITNFIAGMEAMTGLLFFAVATGLVYGRFSKPVIGIMSSHNMLVSPFNKNEDGLMFRITGLRPNVLVEVEAKVILAIDVDHSDHVQREYIPLELDTDYVAFLALSWTVVHPINKKSPIYGYSKEDMIRDNAEVLILIRAYDDAYGQHVHMRFSYVPEEIIWGAKFIRNYFTDEEGEIHLNINAIHEYENATLVGSSDV